MYISVPVHPTEYEALYKTAQVTGLKINEICRLAIHRYTSNLYIDQYNVLEPLGLAIRNTEAVLSRCCATFPQLNSRPLN